MGAARSAATSSPNSADTRCDSTPPGPGSFTPRASTATSAASTLVPDTASAGPMLGPTVAIAAPKAPSPAPSSQLVRQRVSARTRASGTTESTSSGRAEAHVKTPRIARTVSSAARIGGAKAWPTTTPTTARLMPQPSATATAPPTRAGRRGREHHEQRRDERQQHHGADDRGGDVGDLGDQRQHEEQRDQRRRLGDREARDAAHLLAGRAAHRVVPRRDVAVAVDAEGHATGEPRTTAGCRDPRRDLLGRRTAAGCGSGGGGRGARTPTADVVLGHAVPPAAADAGTPPSGSSGPV